MLRVLPPGVAAVASFAAFWWVASGDVERTSWRLTEAPSGTELHLAVWVGGCDSFDTIAVRETDEDVQLQAYIDKGAKSECDGYIGIQKHTVTLRAPVGDRRLLGCNPDDSTYPFRGGESNEDCANNPFDTR